MNGTLGCKRHVRCLAISNTVIGKEATHRPLTEVHATVQYTYIYLYICNTQWHTDYWPIYVGHPKTNRLLSDIWWPLSEIQATDCYIRAIQWYNGHSVINVGHPVPNGLLDSICGPSNGIQTAYISLRNNNNKFLYSALINVMLDGAIHWKYREAFGDYKL